MIFMTPYLIVAAVAYLLGSIPFGYILVRIFRGQDIRQTGSGNIGATNVARKAPGLGVATLILDAAKGCVAVELAFYIFFGGGYEQWWRQHGIEVYLLNRYGLQSLAALFAILGHIFPVWLRFKGGKGVATGVGAFVALAPKAVLVVLVIFALVVAAFRYVSLGSITAAAAFPVFAWLLYRYQASPGVFAAMAAASLLIILKHKDNIRRLLAGTEHRFQLKKG